jgi:hypothetical protein
VIDLDGHPEFQRVILTTRHGIALVQALRLDVADEPADVVDILAETGAIPIQPDSSKKSRARRANPATA